MHRFLRNGAMYTTLLALSQRMPAGPLRAPFEFTYLRSKDRALRRIFANRALLDAFRDATPLPDGYGAGLDDRCVELPWVLAHLPHPPARVLDAGSSLTHRAVLDARPLCGLQLHIVTLAPEHHNFWRRGIGYLYEDIRDLPMRHDVYDTIVCVSVLEHVGLDNSGYGAQVETGGEFTPALRELSRVLRPGGTVLLTVPFGVHRNYGWHQIFDRALLDRAEETMQPARIVETFYRRREGGWQLASPADVPTSR